MKYPYSMLYVLTTLASANNENDLIRGSPKVEREKERERKKNFKNWVSRLGNLRSVKFWTCLPKHPFRLHAPRQLALPLCVPDRRKADREI